MSTNIGVWDVVSNTGSSHAKGSTVLNQCYPLFRGLQVAGTDSNAWVGDIEFSLDSGSTWIYPPCISGCIGSYAISDAISSYGSTVIVDMDTDNPMDGTQCLGGTRCIFALI